MGKKIIEKLESAASSMRESLEKHDGSTLQAIWGNARDGLGNIKESISKNDKARVLLDDIKKLGEDLASAIKAGDKKLSAKILNALEKKIKEYKKEEGEEEKEDTPKLEQ